jgi:drug/metabolite transporter (DMT)-like permease
MSDESKPAVQSSVIVLCVLAGLTALAAFIPSVMQQEPKDWVVIIASGVGVVVSAVVGVLRGMSSTGAPVSGVINSPPK